MKKSIRKPIIISVCQFVFIMMSIFCNADESSDKSEKFTINGTTTIGASFLSQPTLKPTEVSRLTASGKAVLIKGTITGEMNASNKSFLQIVPLPADCSFNFTLDGQGRMALISSSPKLLFPKDGVVKFEIDPLKPGKYLIVNQFPRIANKVTIMLKTVSPLELLIFEVPVNVKYPIAFNMGNVFFH